MIEVRDCLFNIYRFFFYFLATSITLGFVFSQESTPVYTHESQPPLEVINIDFANVESIRESNDFSSLPGEQHEFRIEVGAGRSECLYQWLLENAQLHISIQVLRGMDRNIGFVVKGPGEMVLENLEWIPDANLQKTIPVTGQYQFCLKNELSQFSSKLVYFYLMSYIEEKWHQHSKNILEFFGEADDIQNSINRVEEWMNTIHLEQANSRRNVITDWYLSEDNNSYVQIMSLILCVIILASSVFQVYFVRHLFSTKSAHPKQKTRA